MKFNAKKNSAYDLPVNKDSKSKLKLKPGKENLQKHRSGKLKNVSDVKSDKSKSSHKSRSGNNSTILEEFNKSDLMVPSTVSTASNKSGKYKPIPYTFRIPDGAIPIKQGLVRCPPFQIQLDHTLAVIWSLFSKDKVDKPLGIVQLQWALSFLRTIHNQHGEHPKDVEVCIQVIEDALIEQYAEMVDEDAVRGKSGMCIPIKSKQHQSDVPKLPETKADPDLVVEKLPFSINYAELYRMKPNCSEDTCSEVSNVDITQCKCSTHKRSAVNLDPSSSRSDMIKFLKSWHKEQLGKIEQERERLHSIEALIKNADESNFQPVLNSKDAITILTVKKSKRHKL